MSALWAWFLSTTIGRWIVGVGAVLAALAVAIASAFLYGRGKGKGEQATADKAKDAQSLAQAAQEAVDAANVRKDVDNETAKLPDAPAQSVANADPATAAGQLRDDGWVRPETDGQDGH
jgi:hypothetical protein